MGTLMIKIWTKNTQDLCTEVVSIASELWVPTFDPHPHVMLHLEDSSPCPTRPWPKPKVGVMIPPKIQPTPAEGPKVATDAPPIFVVPGPQLPATSRVDWDGWGNFSPRQLSVSSQACSFQGVNGSTIMCQPKSTKTLGARPTCSNPGPPACGRVGVTSEGVTGFGFNGQGVRLPPTYAVKL